METYQRTRRDIELTIGVDPLDVLHADRREVLKELAPLRARYGPGGTYDARRKAHRSAVANEIAVTYMTETGKKPSETELERLAAADPRVLAMLDTAETEMAAYHLLELQLAEINEVIRRDDQLIRFAAFEPKV